MAKEDDDVPAHKKPDPCKEFSCKLQKCLFNTNYQMGRCEHHLNKMIECCRDWREKSFSCEGFMWMFKDEAGAFTMEPVKRKPTRFRAVIEADQP